MKAILPGRPEASLQAVSTGFWQESSADGPTSIDGRSQGRRIVVYITGNALAIISDDAILQTIYDDDDRKLQAVAFDESSGKIAAATGGTVRVYKPFGLGDDALKWTLQSSF